MKMVKFQLVVAITLIVVSVSACQLRETPEIVPTKSAPTPDVEGTYLPFVTIEKDDGGWGHSEYPGEGLGLDILVQKGDIGKIEDQISPQALNELNKIDFDVVIVISVFQGWQSSGGYSLDILAVIQKENHISVYTDFIEPIPGMPQKEEMTLPYQLIKIRKEGLKEILIFELIVDNVVIQQTEIAISQNE